MQFDERVAFLLAVHVLLAVAGTFVCPHLFEYDRSAVYSHEGWRLFTGAYAHTGAPHLFLNLAGLFALTWLVDREHRVLMLLALPVACFAVFWAEHHWLDHQWACGLSGPLHALAVLPLMQRKPDWVLGTVGLLAVAKAGYELLYGAEAQTEALINAPVLVQHHALGVAGALCAVALTWAYRYTRRHHNATASVCAPSSSA